MPETTPPLAAGFRRRTLNDEWEAFEVLLLAKGMPDEGRDALRGVFYAGASSLWALVNSINAYEEPTTGNEVYLAALMAEIEDFAAGREPPPTTRE